MSKHLTKTLIEIGFPSDIELSFDEESKAVSVKFTSLLIDSPSIKHCWSFRVSDDEPMMAQIIKHLIDSNGFAYGAAEIER